MKRILGPVLLLVSGFIAYQSYLNAEPSPQVEAMAKGTACASAEGCEVEGDRPNVIQTSVVARNYQFLTSGGPVVVTCDREFLWFGDWSCTGAPGQLAY